MGGRPTWTDCDEAGDCVVPNVLSPRDLVARPDKMDETVPHTLGYICVARQTCVGCHGYLLCVFVVVFLILARILDRKFNHVSHNLAT